MSACALLTLVQTYIFSTAHWPLSVLQFGNPSLAVAVVKQLNHLVLAKAGWFGGVIPVFRFILQASQD